MKRACTVLMSAMIGALIAAPLATAHEDISQGRSITYAVIGDTPYGQPQIENFANDVAEINADPSIQMTVHLGDIKNGSSRCDTSYFEQIRNSFDLFEVPLVYTPGDNEWTDCHRTNNGAYTPSERLSVIRQMFFDQPGRTLGDRSMTLDYQRAPFVENVRWSEAGVEFAAIHVVGSNNDWLPWFGAPTRTQDQIDEYTKRSAASVAWLGRTFRIATRKNAKAVVIAIQADMWDAAFSGAANDPTQYDHFTDFVKELATRSKAFGKPVVLFNGDSHQFVDDRPLADQARPYQKTMYGVTADVPNLRRITVNGSTTLCHEWMKLKIDARREANISVERVRFSKQPGFDPVACPLAK